MEWREKRTNLPAGQGPKCKIFMVFNNTPEMMIFVQNVIFFSSHFIFCIFHNNTSLIIYLLVLLHFLTKPRGIYIISNLVNILRISNLVNLQNKDFCVPSKKFMCKRRRRGFLRWILCTSMDIM